MEWHPTCCGIFRVHFERRRSNNSQQRHFEKNSCHFNISNVCIIQTVCVPLTINMTPRVFVLMVIGGAVRTASCLTLTLREACERSPVRRLTERRASCPRMHRLTGKRASCTLRRLTGKRALWLPWLPTFLSVHAPRSAAWDAAVERYLSTPLAAVLPPPARRPWDDMMQSESRICASLQRKWFFWMTHVQPLTNNLVRFASFILGTLPFVKLERWTFVDLVTLPFVNLVTLRFVKVWS